MGGHLIMNGGRAQQMGSRLVSQLNIREARDWGSGLSPEGLSLLCDSGLEIRSGFL
jgi:hypothetical protein